MHRNRPPREQSRTYMQQEPDHRSRHVYKIGILGHAPGLGRIVGLLTDSDFKSAFPWVELVGVANEPNAPEPLDPGDFPVPAHQSLGEMLQATPSLNMLFVLSKDEDYFHTLRDTLPQDISLVSRKSALFIWDLLSSEKLRIVCERDLSYARSLYATIFDEVEEDIILLDSKGRILDANRNVWQRKGVSKEDLIGLACWELEGRDFCCEQKDGRCPYKETLKTGKKSESLHTFVDRDGRMRYFRVYTYPIFDGSDSPTGVMEIRRDITSRTYMEMRLQQSEKMAAIGELSTYIAHEIRNPLFAIGGFANSLMRSGHLGEDDQEKVRIIMEESKRLDNILKSTLNFAKPTEAKEGHVDLTRVAAETLELLSLGWDKKNIELHLELDPGLPKILGDPDLIKQCLINIVKNAQEAMPDGGDLYVRTGWTARHVQLSVEDTGRGIPEEFRTKVFNPFFSTKNKGSGLGLAMTKKIIEEMGGGVELSSQVDKGTRITLSFLPVLAVDEEAENGHDTLE
jgi:PAS domain S-box-containing protein